MGGALPASPHPAGFTGEQEPIGKQFAITPTNHNTHPARLTGEQEPIGNHPRITLTNQGASSRAHR